MGYGQLHFQSTSSRIRIRTRDCSSIESLMTLTACSSLSLQSDTTTSSSLYRSHFNIHHIKRKDSNFGWTSDYLRLPFYLSSCYIHLCPVVTDRMFCLGMIRHVSYATRHCTIPLVWPASFVAILWSVCFSSISEWYLERLEIRTCISNENVMGRLISTSRHTKEWGRGLFAD